MVKTIKKSSLRPEKRTLIFSKMIQWGGNCVKISKKFKNFVPIFLHIPKMLPLKKNP